MDSAASSIHRKGSAASTIVPEDLDEDYIAGAKVLHVSALPQAVSETSRATVRRAIEIAHDHGVTVSFDTNLRLNLWTIEEARATLATFSRTWIFFPQLPGRDHTSHGYRRPGCGHRPLSQPRCRYGRA